MPKLSKRTVDGLKPAEKDYFAWDDDLHGFGLRVWPSGRKVYLIQYRDAGGRTRRKSLGQHGVVTAEQARGKARDMLAGVAHGQNPSEDARRKREAPNVEELCERFMAEYVPSRCKLSTQKEYRRNIDLFIKPKLGPLKVADVERSDIADLHHTHRGIPYQANRTLGVLSVMFNQAEVWGLRPEGTNPCRHVKKYEEKKRERYLTTEELSQLSETLNAVHAEEPSSRPAVNAIRLLILTGCRLGEIQTLKWEYVDPPYLRLPDSKTGARKIPLGEGAERVLANIEREEDNPYVIAGRVKGQHLTDLQRPWRRIRKRADLNDVRLHDLRHTYASHALASGLPIEMVGKLLGHSQIQTTMRYAHLADDPVREAAERVSATLNNSLMQSFPPMQQPPSETTSAEDLPKANRLESAHFIPFKKTAKHIFKGTLPH